MNVAVILTKYIVVTDDMAEVSICYFGTFLDLAERIYKINKALNKQVPGGKTILAEVLCDR